MCQEEAFVDAARKEEVLKDVIEVSLRLGEKKRISPVGKKGGSGLRGVLLSLGRDLVMTWKAEGRKIWDSF